MAIVKNKSVLLGLMVVLIVVLLISIVFSAFVPVWSEHFQEGAYSGMLDPAAFSSFLQKLNQATQLSVNSVYNGIKADQNYNLLPQDQKDVLKQIYKSKAYPGTQPSTATTPATAPQGGMPSTATTPATAPSGGMPPTPPGGMPPTPPRGMPPTPPGIFNNMMNTINIIPFSALTTVYNAMKTDPLYTQLTPDQKSNLEQIYKIRIASGK